MKYTDNLGLLKPENTEFYDVNNQNDNMDIIDEQIKKTNDNVNNLTDSLRINQNARIIYQGVCGKDTVSTKYPISNFKFIRLELCINSVILNSVTIDKTEFVTENFSLRSHWYDSSKVYYQDIKFVSDNSIEVTCNNNATTDGLTFRVIGSYELK